MAIKLCSQQGKSEMSLVHILLVDDSVHWRCFILKHFESKAEFKITGVAIDGLEALQKVNELQPDVILMDVNLPGMSGIEATRQIRKLYSSSKILFVSMSSDWEVVQAAFDVGGSGYVLKTDSVHDLIPGIIATLNGQRFVSRSLTDRSGSSDFQD
jgi:two-component system, NarL family, nitrate/nitrite response regulator NarL